jgi:hypothetical protein
MMIIGSGPSIGECSAHRVCHRAPSEPARESSNVGGSPFQPDLLPMQGFGQADAAQPNSIKRHDVRRDDHIDIEAGIPQANRNVRALDQEPIALPRPAAEVELNHNAACTHGLDAHAAPHPPQQDDGIEFVRHGSPKAQRAPHPPNWSIIDCRSRPAEVNRYSVCLPREAPRRSSTPACCNRRSRPASSVRDM